MINIYRQKKIDPGPDLRKEILEMLGRDPEEDEVTEVPTDEPDAEESYKANTIEDILKCFVGTVNVAFGGGEYTANEVVEFMQTTEESVSKYDAFSGGMYLFRYNPQSSKRYMKQYDALPLVIMLGQQGDGFEGLNLHYLPSKYRISFMRALYGDDELSNINEDDVTSRLARTASFKFVKPCYKSYKYTGVSSRLVQIPPQNWLIASLLPISDFQLRPRKEVWADSVRMINEERRRL